MTKAAFAKSLYREHVSEVSALYEQRLFVLDDAGRPWREVDILWSYPG